MAAICLNTETILQLSNDSVFIYDESGIIEAVNSTATQTFGQSRDEIVGKTISYFLGDTSLPVNYKEKSKDGSVIIEKKVINVNRKNYSQTLLLSVADVKIKLPIKSGHGLKMNKHRYCAFAKELAPQDSNNCNNGNHINSEKDMLKLNRRNGSSITKNQAILDGIMEAAIGASFLINTTGIIKAVNESATHKFGWTREAFIGKSINMILPDKNLSLNNDDGDTSERIYKSFETNVTKRNGDEFISEVTISEIKSIVDERIFCVTIKDITRRMDRETEILDTNRLTNSILDASFDALFIINGKGKIQMVNEAAVRSFGWSKDEFIGSNISIIVGMEHASKHDDYIARYLQTGERRVMGKTRELPARRKDGSQFFIELGLSEAMMDKGSERLFCGFVRDITKRKQDELEIMHKQRLMTGIFDASFDALFNINEKGIIQMVNQAAERNFGWSKEEFIGSNISIIVGEEHASKHDEYIARYLKTGEKRVMGKVRELPARRKDGSTFLIELGLTEVVTEKGEERMFCGFVKDITRRKMHEQQILRSVQLNQGILEAAFDALLTINEKCIIQTVNEAATKQLGWSREELVGQNIKIIVGGGHAENHDGYMARYLKTGEKRVIGKRRELLARRKDGTEFPIELGLTEVKIQGEERIFCGFLRDLTQEKALIKTEIEKKSAEALLLNILPENIATRLKGDPSHIADHFAATTILFADIVGFTELSGKLSPINLVQMLNDLFSRFDDLLDKYHLNKVKTIGDCYMVTSIPQADDEKHNCLAVCYFSMDMMKELHNFNTDNPGFDLNLRVGINTGPVVAGIVGTKRFLYDLWGDAVNIASRMESTGIPGRIQVTKDVLKYVDHEFNFESRGAISVKGKGEMESFLLIGPRKPNSRRDLMEKIESARLVNCKKN